MTNTTSPPFRFLDLPTELRLMVYKLMPNYTIRTRYVKRGSDGSTKSSFTIITYTAPTAILSTCKIIQSEATAVILKTMEQLRPSPDSCEWSPFFAGIVPQIEADSPGLLVLGAETGPVKATFNWYCCIQKSQNADFATSLPCCAYEIYSLLTKHGYVMEGGTLDEAVRALVNFIRKSGCILHLRHTNIRSKYPMKYPIYNTFHIALIRGANIATGTRVAVEEFGKCMGKRTSTYDFCVPIHTFKTISVRHSQAVRRGVEINRQRYHDFRSCTFPVLQEGRSHPDTKYKEAYDQFWSEREWQL